MSLHKRTPEQRDENLQSPTQNSPGYIQTISQSYTQEAEAELLREMNWDLKGIYVNCSLLLTTLALQLSLTPLRSVAVPCTRI